MMSIPFLHKKRNISIRLIHRSPLRRADLPGAISQYELVLKFEPDNIFALNNLALMYHAANDPRSMTLATHLYEVAPDNPQHMDTYGWLLLETGEIERALALLKKATNSEPNDP